MDSRNSRRYSRLTHSDGTVNCWWRRGTWQHRQPCRMRAFEVIARFPGPGHLRGNGSKALTCFPGSDDDMLCWVTYLVCISYNSPLTSASESSARRLGGRRLGGGQLRVSCRLLNCCSRKYVVPSRSSRSLRRYDSEPLALALNATGFTSPLPRPRAPHAVNDGDGDDDWASGE